MLRALLLGDDGAIPGRIVTNEDEGRVIPAQVAVVEDHEGLRRALVRLLQASGHRVSSFASAEALLASEKGRRAACLILDVRLPGVSGFELHERLTLEGSDAPVIYVTAYDEPGARQRAARDGAPLFLKPVDGRALLAAIKRALAEAPC
jgi:FixJ family two-component response regulator